MNFFSNNQLNAKVEAVLQGALDRVTPRRTVTSHITVDDDGTTVRHNGESIRFSNRDFDRILVLGVGKASAQMAAVLEELLGDRIDGGVVVTKYGHGVPLKRLRLVEAGHPIPDEAGLQAAREIEALAEAADERTLCVTLISGGGSALLVNPFHDETTEVSLQEMQQTTKELLACGALIQEINCVRKHISHLKGGRLAQLLYPATSVNLILSDVVGDDLASIASGVTVPDGTTYREAREILQRYGVEDKIPRSVRNVLQRGVDGNVPETPKVGDALFDRVHNFLVGSNFDALEAAQVVAEEQGYRQLLLSSQITGEAKEIAKVFAAIAREVRSHSVPVASPACVLGGGETTVTLHGAGKGGRAQEAALAFLAEMERKPELYDGVTFVALGTDGNDGQTGVAGGTASLAVLEAARERGVSIQEYLWRNDSYTFFQEVGGVLKTGETGTNVCDLYLLFLE